jgi:hypothetical protein
MNMTQWFLTELESEAAKSRRVLEQVPAGKRDWKPHERSMPLGYLSELVANIFSWVGMAISLDELDIAPKDGPKHKPVPLNTSAELVAALDKAVAQAREALQKTTDAHLATPWRLLAGGNLAMEQPRVHVIPRYVPALSPSPRADDGVSAPARVEGAIGVRADCRRQEFWMNIIQE